MNRNKARSFPGADVGSNHELVMLSMAVKLRKQKIEKSIRILYWYDLDKLRDPNMKKCVRSKHWWPICSTGTTTKH